MKMQCEKNKSKSYSSRTDMSNKSKLKTVYNPILLVEKISPLGIKWYMHRDEPYILGILLDGEKYTPTGIVRKIAKRYGRTCYKETVRKILFVWKDRGLVRHQEINDYVFFWLEKNSLHGEEHST